MCQYSEYAVRFIIRLAACNPLRATGQRAHGRALCTPGLATSLPAATRYLHSFMCPLRTGHDSLLLSMTSRSAVRCRPTNGADIRGKADCGFVLKPKNSSDARVEGFGALFAAPNLTLRPAPDTEGGPSARQHHACPGKSISR